MAGDNCNLQNWKFSKVTPLPKSSNIKKLTEYLTNQLQSVGYTETVQTRTRNGDGEASDIQQATANGNWDSEVAISSHSPLLTAISRSACLGSTASASLRARWISWRQGKLESCSLHENIKTVWKAEMKRQDLRPKLKNYALRRTSHTLSHTNL